MIKKLLSCLLVAWLAQTASGQASPERQKKRYVGCHLFISSKTPSELDLSFPNALPPPVYGLFKFLRRGGPEPGIPSDTDAPKGPVKTVERRRRIPPGKPLGSWVRSFDRGGRLTGEISEKRDGQVYSQKIFEYDAAGRKQAEEYRYDDPCVEDGRWVYKYESAAGRLVELQKYNLETGRPSRKLAYTYSADGRNVREEEVWSEDRRLLLREFTLDEAGFVTVTSFSRIEGGSRVVYTFDAGGRLVKVITHQNPTAPGRFSRTLQYGAGGKVAEERFYLHDSPTVRLYRFNEQGDTVSMEQYEPDGSPAHGTRYSYEYDGHGNWVKRTAWTSTRGRENEKPFDVVTRELTYY